MENEVAEKTRGLTALLESKLGAKGKTLETALKRAGRQVPRRLRAQGRLLVEAEGYAAHPKLMQRVDMAEVETAAHAFEVWLGGIDPKEARKTRMLNMAALLAFQFLLILVALIAFLRWRGLV